jgi:hypothetical protein
VHHDHGHDRRSEVGLFEVFDHVLEVHGLGGELGFEVTIVAAVRLDGLLGRVSTLVPNIGHDEAT